MEETNCERPSTSSGESVIKNSSASTSSREVIVLPKSLSVRCNSSAEAVTPSLTPRSSIARSAIDIEYFSSCLSKNKKALLSSSGIKATCKSASLPGAAVSQPSSELVPNGEKNGFVGKVGECSTPSQGESGGKRGVFASETSKFAMQCGNKVDEFHDFDDDDNYGSGGRHHRLQFLSQPFNPTPHQLIADVDDLIASEILSNFDNFLFDCDGVIWNGGRPIPNAQKTIQLLREMNKNLLFVTNNASGSRRTYKSKFDRYGIHVEEDEIVCSSFVAALLLKEHFPHVRRALVIGEGGLRDELREANVEPIYTPLIPASQLLSPRVLSTTPPSDSSKSHERTVKGTNGCNNQDQNNATSLKKIGTEEEFLQFAREHLDPTIEAVVVGWDREFDFHKLCVASLYLQTPSAIPLIATNLDPFDRIQEYRMPGNAQAVRAIESTAGRKAINVGKPSKYLANWLVKHYQLDRSRTIFFGDRLETDIALACVANFASALVLTGVVTPHDVEECIKFVTAPPTSSPPCLSSSHSQTSSLPSNPFLCEPQSPVKDVVEAFARYPPTFIMTHTGLIADAIEKTGMTGGNGMIGKNEMAVHNGKQKNEVIK